MMIKTSPKTMTVSSSKDDTERVHNIKKVDKDGSKTKNDASSGLKPLSIKTTDLVKEEILRKEKLVFSLEGSRKKQQRTG